MNRHFSIYRDAVRFFMAFVVFLPLGLSTLPGHDPHSVPRGLLLWLLTLGTILLIGRVTEQWRYGGRSILRRWFPAATTHSRSEPAL